MKKKIVLSTAVLLVAITVVLLCVGCTPSIDAIAKKFENKGYTVSKTDTEVIAGDPQGDSAITITWFEDKDAAQDFYEKALAVNSEKTVAKRGRAVAVGDEKSINIFK